MSPSIRIQARCPQALGSAILVLLLAASGITPCPARAQVEPELFETTTSGPFHIGKITFYGHTRTRESTLRRVLGVHEGELFDLSRVRAGIGRLQTLVEIESDQSIDMRPDPIGRVVDLDLHVVERDVFYPEGGAGYSQVDGWSGHGSLSARNGLGFGEIFALSIREGQLQSSYQVGASVPALFGGLFDASLQLFDDQIEYEFPDRIADRARQGLVVQLGRRLGERSQVFAGYRLSAARDRSGDRVFEPFGASFQESALALGYTWDSHDQTLDPRRGRRLRLGLETSGGLLGGDVSALLPRLELATTNTLAESPSFSSVVRARFAAAWIEPLATTASGVPAFSPLDRFFLGGPGSIRGYGHRSIWLRDAATGESIRDENGEVRGGDGSAILNLELHLIPNGPVRIVLFADGGQLLSQGVEQELFGLRASAGLELQIRLPSLQVPLRLIWAENLTPLAHADFGSMTEERFDQLSFGIGLSF